MTAAPEPDVALVQALLAEQHPDLAHLAVTVLGAGWDNAVFRVGPALTARLPRRIEGVPLLAHEQRWLPELAPLLPLPVPAPVRVGAPGCGYPWPWSLCPWLPGEPASQHPPADLGRAAGVLGGFLAALHRPAPDEAPANPLRGVPLADRAPRFHDAARQLTTRPDRIHPRRLAWCVDRWGALVDGTAPWSGPPVWVHGDLHPHNLLVHEGDLAAVVDFGDVTAGDPATDLSVGWMLLDADTREAFRHIVDHDDDTWRRAEAWAVALSVAYLEGSPDGSPILGVAERTLAELGAPVP